jgi:hypothetical protein
MFNTNITALRRRRGNEIVLSTDDPHKEIICNHVVLCCGPALPLLSKRLGLSLRVPLKNEIHAHTCFANDSLASSEWFFFVDCGENVDNHFNVLQQIRSFTLAMQSKVVYRGPKINDCKSKSMFHIWHTLCWPPHCHTECIFVRCPDSLIPFGHGRKFWSRCQCFNPLFRRGIAPFHLQRLLTTCLSIF